MSNSEFSKTQPIDTVRWVDPKELIPNKYNPNHVFGPEFDLLVTSLLTDGWSDPIKVNKKNEIVDGFHRWSLVCPAQHQLRVCDTMSGRPNYREAVAKMTNGLVPVVTIYPETQEDQEASTVRYNRARGTHEHRRMAQIVQGMVNRNLSVERISHILGMEEEEIEILADPRGSPEQAGAVNFGKGWKPVRKAEAEAKKR